MGIIDVRYGCIVFTAVVTILILFMCLLAQISLQASGGKGIPDRAKQKTVFKHNWEDIHCRRKHANETTVEKSWIPELAKQLNLKDGTSVFDSNTGCNEWLTLLRKEYPKLVIGGAHIDQYAVEYAKKLFNDTPSTFGTISPDGKLNFLKKVIMSRANDGREEWKPKYEPHEKMYFCDSQTGVSGDIASSLQKLSKHVLNTNLVFPGSLSKGIELAKKMNELRKGNLSHT
ncbi:hypothetical protein ACROYT_G023378 [Oculina patagonica]